MWRRNWLAEVSDPAWGFGADFDEVFVVYWGVVDGVHVMFVDGCAY
jgi:hypothetical protein